MRVALLGVVPLALAGCVFGPPPVARVVAGREHVGRYIPPEAYASYAEGAYLEAHDKPRQAEHAYRDALAEDPDSAEIWTRLGALACRRAPKQAARAFAHARSIDASYAPLWREQAQCDLSHDRASAALTAARKAFHLDPDDEKTSVIMAELFTRQGDADAALRWLEALVTRDPTSLPGWRALLATARDAGNRQQELRAARALIARAPAERADLEKRYPQLAPSGSVDDALLSGQIKKARRRALSAHLPLGDLAVRAARLGLGGTAAELADEVLHADPDDANAWVARLVAADLSGDNAAFNSALASLGKSPVTPRPPAARLLAQLLQRRAGRVAAEHWRNAYGLPLPAKQVTDTPDAPSPVSE